jgi:hypothetical protein
MKKQDQAQGLLHKIAKTAEDAQQKPFKGNSHAQYESWSGTIDLTPYKKSKLWPGKNYCLMGNSFNLEITNNSPRLFQRISSIKLTLDQLSTQFRCMTVKDALTEPAFLHVLSRFERDWLGRLPAETLIGPAFNDRGELIETAFSVWRQDFVPMARVKA